MPSGLSSSPAEAQRFWNGSWRRRSPGNGEGPGASRGLRLHAPSVMSPSVGQLTLTWMLLGLASAFLGRWTESRPFLASALIWSALTVAGSEKLRLKVP